MDAPETANEPLSKWLNMSGVSVGEAETNDWAREVLFSDILTTAVFRKFISDCMDTILRLFSF